MSSSDRLLACTQYLTHPQRSLDFKGFYVVVAIRSLALACSFLRIQSHNRLCFHCNEDICTSREVYAPLLIISLNIQRKGTNTQRKSHLYAMLQSIEAETSLKLLADRKLCIVLL